LHHHYVFERAWHFRAYFRHFVDIFMMDAYAIDLKAARRALPPFLRGYTRPVHWLALAQ
jgi:putative hemolysin